MHGSGFSTPASSGGGGSGGNSYEAQTITSSPAALVPASGQHSAALNFTGGAGTYLVSVPTASRAAGDIVQVTGSFPATAGLKVEITNATSGGTVILNYMSDGSTRSFYARLVFDGTEWDAQFFSAPAY